MGLDGELYARRGHGNATEFKDIKEWRKHYEIQIWMHALADSKGDQYDERDGWYGPVALTAEDLAKFKEALLRGEFDDDFPSLPWVTKEEGKENAQKAIALAQQLMSDGWEILYSSSY